MSALQTHPDVVVALKVSFHPGLSRPLALTDPLPMPLCQLANSQTILQICYSAKENIKRQLGAKVRVSHILTNSSAFSPVLTESRLFPVILR